MEWQNNYHGRGVSTAGGPQISLMNSLNAQRSDMFVLQRRVMDLEHRLEDLCNSNVVREKFRYPSFGRRFPGQFVRGQAKSTLSRIDQLKDSENLAHPLETVEGQIESGNISSIGSVHSNLVDAKEVVVDKCTKRRRLKKPILDA